MSSSRWVGWLMLLVWASWFAAVQGIAVDHSALGPWVPDLGLLLLIACAARFHVRDVPFTALLVAMSRAAYSVEPPAAILAGFLGLAMLVQSVRRVAEVGRPFVRTLVASVAALLFSTWLVLVGTLRAGASAPMQELVRAIPDVVPNVVATAVFGLVFGGLLVLLPGLTPLRARRW